MKMRVITILEIILFILFTTGYFLHGAHIPYLNSMTLIVFSSLAIFYWLPLSVLKSYGISAGLSIAMGMVFSVDLVAILFGLFRWPFSSFYLIFALVINTVILLAAGFLYLVKRRNGLQVKYEMGLIVRFFVYFLFVLFTYVTH